ncbi:outer membrane protein [Cupriavidus basilensis OR16]|uniref:Outer membrane protein n=1 Tax=Cupriavidus basilensis OR16 TaxID=1127483 RepID=H1S4T2_9BURK|nr:porin [Cupriavidus basilensis]EHP42469.1 outer membrane protein [Cupriavidus basilensis OR16]
MKRSLSSLAALSALTGVAHAQSSVTLYGVVDANIEYVTNIAPATPTVNPATGQVTVGPGNNRFALSSGGMSASRWGLRGVEDLGGGTKALFVLESGFGLDDGKSMQGGRLFGRQAFVGLSNSLGSVTFGRQYTSLGTVLANFSPTGYAYQYEPLDVMTGINYRSDNTIKYAGKFGAVSGEAYWSFGNGVAGAGEVPGQFRRDIGYGAALVYASGPFSATVAYDEYDPTITPVTGAYGKFRKAAAAVNYTFNRAVIMAGYRWGKNQFSDGMTALRDDFWWIGGNYQITPALTVTLAYYYEKLRTVMLTPSAPTTHPANPWQTSFIVDYNLSKRTDVYFTTAYAKNAGLDLHSVTLGFSNVYALGAGKNNMFGAAMGIRHKF